LASSQDRLSSSLHLLANGIKPKLAWINQKSKKFILKKKKKRGIPIYLVQTTISQVSKVETRLTVAGVQLSSLKIALKTLLSINPKRKSQ